MPSITYCKYNVWGGDSFGYKVRSCWGGVGWMDGRGGSWGGVSGVGGGVLERVAGALSWL